MKIAFFTDTYYPQLNGVTITIENFTKELTSQGHQVYIFAPKISGYKDKEPNIFRVRSFKVLSSEPEARAPLLIPSKNLAAMFRLDFDVVHAHGNGAFSFLGYQVARLKNIPYILTFHTLHTRYTHYFFDGKVIKPKMVEAGMRVFGNLCDGVITPSLKMKHELKQYGVKKSIKVVPNFIDFQRFNSSEKDFLKNKFNLNKDSKILLSVGRLGKEKNFDFLIRVLKGLKNPNYHLVLVGKGPEQEALATLARDLKVSEFVHFTGNIDSVDMPKAYSGADIFVFASTTETQGICVLEAAASQLPIVVVKDEAFAGMVENNVNGFVLDLKEEEFIDSISKILQNRSLFQDLSKSSRELAIKNFSGEVITKDLVSFYNTNIRNYKKKKRIFRRIVDRLELARFLKVTERINKILMPS